MKARITLINSEGAPRSHTSSGGRRLARGESFITTKPEDVAYYRGQPGFSVEIINESVPKVAKKASSKPRTAPVETAPVDEGDEEDDDEEDDDEEDDDEEDDDEEDEAESNGEEGPAAPLTFASLKDMTKSSLQELAKERSLELKGVDNNSSKTEIIRAILKAAAQPKTAAK